MDAAYYNTADVHAIEGGGDYPEKISFFVDSVKKYYKKSPHKNLKILDIGCHEGELSRKFKSYGKVYGVDFSKRAVERAQKYGIDAKVADALSIPKIYKTIQFDIVTAGDIIEHIFDTDTFLEGVYSVLKNDGVLLLSTPNIVSLGRRLMALFGKNPYCEYNAKADGLNVGHIRYYSKKNLEDQLADHSYQDVSVVTDITNAPFPFVDVLLLRTFPGLGRELYATAYKR